MVANVPLPTGTGTARRGQPGADLPGGQRAGPRPAARRSPRRPRPASPPGRRSRRPRACRAAAGAAPGSRSRVAARCAARAVSWPNTHSVRRMAWCRTSVRSVVERRVQRGQPRGAHPGRRGQVDGDRVGGVQRDQPVGRARPRRRCGPRRRAGAARPAAPAAPRHPHRPPHARSIPSTAAPTARQGHGSRGSGRSWAGQPVAMQVIVPGGDLGEAGVADRDRRPRAPPPRTAAPTASGSADAHRERRHLGQPALRREQHRGVPDLGRRLADRHLQRGVHPDHRHAGAAAGRARPAPGRCRRSAAADDLLGHLVDRAGQQRPDLRRRRPSQVTPGSSCTASQCAPRARRAILRMRPATQVGDGVVPLPARLGPRVEADRERGRGRAPPAPGCARPAARSSRRIDRHRPDHAVGLRRDRARRSVAARPAAPARRAARPSGHRRRAHGDRHPAQHALGRVGALDLVPGDAQDEQHDVEVRVRSARCRRPRAAPAWR